MLSDKERIDLRQRIKKVAGQVNGIDKMLEDGRYCIDVIQQILAARAALNKAALIILESHAKSCIISAISEGRTDESIDELMSVIKQFNK